MKRLVNAITCTRFVFALILVLAAPGSAWFWAAYGLGAVSDVLDGLRARRFGVQSDGGGKTRQRGGHCVPARTHGGAAARAAVGVLAAVRGGRSAAHP